MLVLYASQKGCAEGLAKDIAGDLVSGGVEGVGVMSMEQYVKQVIVFLGCFFVFGCFWSGKQHSRIRKKISLPSLRK